MDDTHTPISVRLNRKLLISMYLEELLKPAQVACPTWHSSCGFPLADRLLRWLKVSSGFIEVFGIYSRYPARCCWGNSTPSRLQSENIIYNTSQKAANDIEEEKMKFKAI